MKKIANLVWILNYVSIVSIFQIFSIHHIEFIVKFIIVKLIKLQLNIENSDVFFETWQLSVIFLYSYVFCEILLSQKLSWRVFQYTLHLIKDPNNLENEKSQIKVWFLLFNSAFVSIFRYLCQYFKLSSTSGNVLAAILLRTISWYLQRTW